MGSGRLAGILLVTLALSGCVTSAPEPGLSEAESAEIRTQLSDSLWESTGLPTDRRPPDPASTAVSIDEWAATIVACMRDAGYTNYAVASGGGYTSEGNPDDGELIAGFVCRLSVTIDYGDSAYLNHAQRDYLYDYYQRNLVPCLANHGISVSEAPTRAEFQELLGAWNPYYAVPNAQQGRMFSDEELKAECSFYPPDMPDPGYFS